MDNIQYTSTDIQKDRNKGRKKERTDNIQYKKQKYRKKGRHEERKKDRQEKIQYKSTEIQKERKEGRNK